MNMLKIAAGIAAMAVAGCGSFGSGTRTTYPARITVSPPASGAVADEVVRDAFHRAAALRRMSPDLAVEIVFAEGVYHLSSPIMLGPDMSGSAALPLRMKGGDIATYKVVRPPECSDGGTIAFHNYYIASDRDGGQIGRAHV